jgi:hypothetical protein
MGHQQVVHVIGMFLFLDEDLLDHFSRSGIVVAEVADELALLQQFSAGIVDACCGPFPTDVQPDLGRLFELRAADRSNRGTMNRDRVDGSFTPMSASQGVR